MDLTVVGCSGSLSGPDSPASCYLVQAPHQGRTFSLLLDLGPGAAGALYRHLDPAAVDAVALSHLHPDHCLDLCGFYVAASYGPSAPWDPVDVYGPAGTAARIAAAYAVMPGEEPEVAAAMAERFRWHDWAPEQRIGPFVVATAPVDHPVPAVAIRVREGEDEDAAVLVYSGDTGPCALLVEQARGADLLLCEAAFGAETDQPPHLHLSGADAGAAATAAGVGTLVLTHIPPWYDRDQTAAAARRTFAGPVQLATPGARWAIG